MTVHQRYVRPILQSDAVRPAGALSLRGGRLWFDHVAIHRRGADSEHVPVAALTDAERDRLTGPGFTHPWTRDDRPTIMGIVNVTPDSFSDGGNHATTHAAVAHAGALVAAGADILDIGGESTRPGADAIPEQAEIDRIAPVIAARAADPTPMSIDTRKAAVAEVALAAGACLVNDVSALTHDPPLADVIADFGAPVCLMHTLGDPTTMQDDPRYGDVTLDVYDWLADRIAVAEAAGIDRSRILIDPGIGFGKTMAHNLTLLRDVAIFHSLGCPLLVGASRKRFIGRVTGTEVAADRVHGSVAVALAMADQGVQVLRVHDVAPTWQALTMQAALRVSSQGDAE